MLYCRQSPASPGGGCTEATKVAPETIFTYSFALCLTGGSPPGFFRRRPAGLEKQNLVTVSEIEAPRRLRGHKEAKVDDSFRFSRFGNQKLTTVLDSRASGSKS